MSEAAYRNKPWGAQQGQRLPALPWLLLGYAGLWVAAYWVSNTYWFLPAGLRFATLLLLPMRRWVWVALAEAVAMTLLVYLQDWSYSTLAGGALALCGPFLTFALAAALWRRSNPALLPESPQSLATLLSLIMAACALLALILSAGRLIENTLSWGAASAELFSYMVGDFIGVLVVAPLLVQIGSPRAVWRDRSVWRDLSITLLPLVATLIVVAQWQPDATPFVALFAMGPPVWLAYRAGWRGAALAVSSVSAAVYYTTAGVVSNEAALLLQMFLAVLGAVAIMVGAWSGLERRLRERLELGNAELEQANRALNEQSGEMRLLGARLVRAQEEEQQRIRADMRGELSQNISALSGQLAMLVRRIDQPELLAMVDTLRTYVQGIRDAAEECIERLHPQAMSRLDLKSMLNAGTLRTCLDAAGIVYSVRVVGPEIRLGTQDRVTLYRVVQHVAATSMRYSDAVSLAVNVLLPAATDEPWIEVSCSLACRAPLRVEALEGESDIRALRDRMLAVGGRFDIAHSGETGVVCLALFPLAEAELSAPQPPVDSTLSAP